jgi:hypothetical protein
MTTRGLAATRVRRRALLGGGAAALAATLFPSLGGRAYGAAPKRLVLVWGHHGPFYDEWKMWQGGAAGADWQYALDGGGAPSQSAWSAPLRPLYPHRSRIIVLDGLGLLTAFRDADGPGNEHAKGQVHSLTGAMVAGDGVAGGPSIDQVVAGSIQRTGALKSLELTAGDGAGLPFVWAGRGQRIPSIGSPEMAFDRVFGSFQAPAGPMAAAPTDRDKIAARQGAVAAFVRDQFNAFAPKLGGDDRRRLESHRDMLSDLQQRLTGSAASAGGAIAGCSKPPRAGAGSYAERADVMTRLAVAALACDQTRVVTLQLPQVPNDMVGVSNSEDLHNKYIHSNNQGVATKQAAIYGGVFAKLLDQLVAIPEDGGTMLDNTLCVWVHELATGGHDFFNYPAVVAGLGSTFKLGRYVHLAQNLPTPFPHPNWTGVVPTVGPGHNKLWVSVANALGVATDQVGEASVVDTKFGMTISLKGPLTVLRG